MVRAEILDVGRRECGKSILLRRKREAKRMTKRVTNKYFKNIRINVKREREREIDMQIDEIHRLEMKGTGK